MTMNLNKIVLTKILDIMPGKLKTGHFAYGCLRHWQRIRLQETER